MKKLPIISTILVAVCILIPQGRARALVCSYTSGGQDACETFLSDVDMATAITRCDLVCQKVSPTCTAHAVRDNCPEKAQVIRPVSLVPPFDFANSPQQLIGRIVGQVVGILGALTFLVFAYGGFMWLTSAGNEEKIASGSQAMLWAVIGLFVVFSSYIIVNVILKSIAR